MIIHNPFTDRTFADFQVKSKKAKQVFSLPKGQFAYLYPLFKDYNIIYATGYSSRIKKIAQDNNVIYTLIESYDTQLKPTKNPLKQIIPRYTLAIDLTESPEHLLKKMHPKGRYNIKLSTRKGVIVKEEFNVDTFYDILKTTAKRDGFFLNSKEYYQLFFESLNSKLFIAYFDDKPIAGVLNIYLNDHTAIYYYGASSNEHRNLMAPYLLQWHSITDAKDNGYKTYDFLGTADPDNPHDPLQGVSYFKQKFGGTLISWPGSQIVVHKPFLYTLLKVRQLISQLKTRLQRIVKSITKKR